MIKLGIVDCFSRKSLLGSIETIKTYTTEHGIEKPGPLSPSHSSCPRCLITQRGRDGFGHQLEGKVSCVVAEHLAPQRLAYVHTRFYTFEHAVINLTLAEQLVALDHYASWINDGRFAHVVNVGQDFVVHVVSGKVSCQSNIVYSVDNCWELIYFPPFVQTLIEAEQLSLLSLVQCSRTYDHGTCATVIILRLILQWGDPTSFSMLEEGILAEGGIILPLILIVQLISTSICLLLNENSRIPFFGASPMSQVGTTSYVCLNDFQGSCMFLIRKMIF